MRIKSRVSVSIAATLATGLIILVYTYTAMIWMHDGLSKINLYYELSSKVSELGSLTDKYLANPKERVREQWLSVQASVGNILGRIESEHGNETILLNSIRKRHMELNPLFQRLVETASQPLGTTPGESFKGRLDSHFSVQISLIQDDVSSLIEMRHSSIESYQRGLTFVTLAVVMLLVFSICFFLYFTNKEIVRSFLRMHEGTKIIGGGNLSHVINITRNDEIGELAASLNQMTGDLRERTEELALAKSEAERRSEWLRVVLTSIGDGVIATDIAGMITFLNPVAEHMTGWQGREALGQPLASVFKIINEKSRQVIESPVDKVLLLGNVAGLANHTVLIARDGHETPIDDSGSPVREADGTVNGVVLVFHDVTERKQMEEELRRSRDELEIRVLERTAELKTYMGKLKDSNQALKDFASIASHDLQEPLRKVSGLREFAQTEVRRVTWRAGQ